MPRLTDAEITEARRLCEEATPGPWEYDAGEIRSGPTNKDVVVDSVGDSGFWHQADGKLCALARTLLPRLLEEVAALRASLDQVDDVLVVNFVGPRKDGDYRRALSDLVALNIQIENDPRVSLTAKVRQDELEALRADRDRLDELQRLVLDGADIVRDDERLIVFIQKEDPTTCGPLYCYRGDGENALRDAVDAAQKGEREWKLNRTK